MTYFRTNIKKKHFFENVWHLILSLFFSPLVLAIQKAYCKNASDFYLGKKEVQTSLEVSSRNFANNGLYWLQFLNLWCTRTKHNLLSKIFQFWNTSTNTYKFVCWFT